MAWRINNIHIHTHSDESLKRKKKKVFSRAWDISFHVSLCFRFILVLFLDFFLQVHPSRFLFGAYIINQQFYKRNRFSSRYRELISQECIEFILKIFPFIILIQIFLLLLARFDSVFMDRFFSYFFYDQWHFVLKQTGS